MFQHKKPAYEGTFHVDGAEQRVDAAADAAKKALSSLSLRNASTGRRAVSSESGRPQQEAVGHSELSRNPADAFLTDAQRRDLDHARNLQGLYDLEKHLSSPDIFDSAFTDTVTGSGSSSHKPS